MRCQVSDHFAYHRQLDLGEYVSKSGVSCMNESSAHTVANIFSDGPGFLESDCDEQVEGVVMVLMVK